MNVESSRGMVYEILGNYIDSLCNSLYVGRARGSAVLYQDEIFWPLTTLERPLPFLDIFYYHGTLEIAGMWHDGGNHGFFLRAAISMVELIKEGDIMRLVIYPHGKMEKMRGIIILTLHAGRGLEETFESILRDERCSREMEKEGDMISSLASPLMPHRAGRDQAPKFVTLRNSVKS